MQSFNNFDNGNHPSSSTAQHFFAFGVYGQQEPSQLVLKNEKEWKKFDNQTNEMKIGNNGKDFFPRLEYRVEKLDPTALYVIGLRQKRLNFKGMMEYSKKEGWFESKDGVKEGVPMYSNEVLTSVKSGLELMKTGYKAGKMFNVGSTKKKVKRDEKGLTLTNEDIQLKQEKQRIELENQRKTQTEVTTRCQYQPIVTLYQVMDNGNYQFITSSEPSITKFIPVTEIKNDVVRNMRGSDNPLVRGDYAKKAKDGLAANGVSSISENKTERKTSQKMKKCKSVYSVGTPSPTSTKSSSPSSTVNSDPYSPVSWDNMGMYNHYSTFTGPSHPIFQQNQYGGGGFHDFNHQFQTNWGGMTDGYNGYPNQQYPSFSNYHGGFDSTLSQSWNNQMTTMPPSTSTTTAIVSEPTELPNPSHMDISDMSIEEMIKIYS